MSEFGSEAENKVTPTRASNAYLERFYQNFDASLKEMALPATVVFGFLSGLSAAHGDAGNAIIAGVISAGSAWASKR